jgi:hypothetical protein
MLALGCSLDDHPSLGWDDSLLSKPREAGPSVLPNAAGSGAAGELATPVAEAAVDSNVLDAGASSADAGPTAAPSGVAPADAGRPSRCPAGDFLINLDCTFTTDGLNTPWSTTLTVQPTAAQDESANVSADVAFKFLEQSFSGDIVGTLSCATGRLQLRFDNGMCMLLTGGPPLPFDGTLEGALDAQGQNVSGTWWYGTEGGPMCDGAWSGALQP